MAKQNCWEFKKCGRQADGAKANELGVCPAAVETKANGINGGAKGGRACWALAGTFCGGNVQGSFAAKFGNCVSCEFYKLVQGEERGHLCTAAEIMQKVEAKVPVAR
jgi:hypothetical protein